MTLRKTDLVPLLMALLGAALMLISPAASQLIEAHSGPGLAAVDAAIWLAAAAWLYGYMPQHIHRRYVFVAALFLLGIFPLDSVVRPMPTLQLLALAGLTLLAAGLISCRGLHPALIYLSRSLQRLSNASSALFLGSMYMLFLTVTVSLSWYCFSFLPVVIDTISQYMHAKFMAAGHLWWPMHPLQRFFNTGMMIAEDGKWYSQYQPLPVMLLAIGMKAGAPWLVNPLLGALTLLATYALARRIDSETTAKLAALLVLLAPFILFMSSEYMNHATSLFCGTLFMLAYIMALETRQLYWAVACGLALGGVFLTRPLDAIEIALPFAFYSLYLLRRDARACLPLFLLMALGVAACLVFQGWYNVQTTGDIWLFPYAKHHDTNTPGFNKGHTLWAGLVEAHNLWLSVNQMLFEWYVPCTILAACACLSPLKNPYLRLMLAVVISTTLVNTINRFHSSIFGPRYLYEMTTALIILSACGIRRLPQLLAQLAPRLPHDVASGIATCLLITAFASGWGYRMPAEIRHYSNGYVNGNPKLYFSLMAHLKPPALVFISDRPPHTGIYADDDYLSLAHTNPPLADAPIIFARDLGLKDDRALMAYYPGRTAYLLRNRKVYFINPTTFRPEGLDSDEP